MLMDGSHEAFGQWISALKKLRDSNLDQKGLRKFCKM